MKRTITMNKILFEMRDRKIRAQSCPKSVYKLVMWTIHKKYDTNTVWTKQTFWGSSLLQSDGHLLILVIQIPLKISYNFCTKNGDAIISTDRKIQAFILDLTKFREAIRTLEVPGTRRQTLGYGKGNLGNDQQLTELTLSLLSRQEL